MTDENREREWRRGDGIGLSDPASDGTSMDDRALSDLVGFVLAFAVIVTAVGLVSTFGMDALEDARESELAKNTERSFVLLGQNFDELENGQAARRTSEIELRSGSLGVRNSTTIGLEIKRPSDDNFERTFAPRSLQYRIDGEAIAYENGATFRGNIGVNASVIELEPGLVCGDDYAVVSLVEVRQLDGRTISGGVARVSGTRVSSELLYPRNRTGGTDTATDGTQLNVTVDSQFSGGWQQYFTRAGNGWKHPEPDEHTYVCEVGDSGSIYLKRTVLEIGLDQ
jgi:hypothetical protein